MDHFFLIVFPSGFSLYHKDKCSLDPKSKVLYLGVCGTRVEVIVLPPDVERQRGGGGVDDLADTAALEPNSIEKSLFKIT